MDFKEIKITDNFWCFEQKGVRCFLFKGSPFSLLIDSCYGGELKELCEQKTGNEVRHLVTHSDRDHIGCMGRFKQVYMHPAEAIVLSEKSDFPVSYVPITDGAVIDIGTFKFEVLHLPGHAPGNVALLEKEKRFLLGGDIVQTGPIYMFGKQRSLSSYASSLNRLRKLRDGFEKCYSSHFDLTVSPDIIDDLYTLADEMSRGIYPDPLPLPYPLPPGVPSDRHLFAKGRAKFYF